MIYDPEFVKPMTQAEGATALERLKEQFKPRSFDGSVYHYTSLAALSGITASRKMFCTEYRQLNDRSEFIFGLGVMEALIAARGEELGLSNDDLSFILDMLAKLRLARFHLSIFCASWCMSGNDLSQWRAYAPRDGVAIAFNSERLKALAEQQGFACGAVRYFGAPLFDEWFDEQLKELRDGLNRMKEDEQHWREAHPEDSESLFNLKVGAMRHAAATRWIGEVCSLVKHPDFMAEREWRTTIVIQMNGFGPRLPVLVRPSGARAVPYVELDFSSGELPVITKVSIGPSPNSQANFDAVTSMNVAAQVELPGHVFIA